MAISKEYERAAPVFWLILVCKLYPEGDAVLDDTVHAVYQVLGGAGIPELLVQEVVSGSRQFHTLEYILVKESQVDQDSITYMAVI